MNDHALIFKEMGFRIPLSIHGIFSFFQTTKPMVNELQVGHDVYILTPERWNPHTDAYSMNEASMLDREGNMRERSEWTNKIVLDEVNSDMDESYFTISTTEARRIDEIFMANERATTEMGVQNRVPKECDQVATVLGEISSMLDASTLNRLLRQRADLACDEGIIGATTAIEEEFLLEDNGSEERSEGDEGEATGDVYETTTPGAGTDELDLDEVFTAGVEAIHQGKVNAKHLAKIWRISYDDATRTIDAMSQHSVRSEDPTLSQNYRINDCVLRYRRIKDYFFMDTFFATSKGGKSSCGNTCCQLFLTDKGFLYVVAMKQKSEVMQAFKQFAKEVGAPNAIVCDMASEQTSAEVKQFCNTIGTTLQALEEGTSWANNAELYVKLMKEVVWKEMQVANSPLPFWDYCLEHRAQIYNMMAHDNLKIQGTNPHTATLGVEGDISNLCQYSWYNWCHYRDHNAKFPHDQEVLG